MLGPGQPSPRHTMLTLASTASHIVQNRSEAPRRLKDPVISLKGGCFFPSRNRFPVQEFHLRPLSCGCCPVYICTGEKAVTVSEMCITVGISESNSHRLCAVKAPLRYLVDAVSASSEMVSPLPVISISPSTSTPQDEGFVQRQDCASAKYRAGKLGGLSCFGFFSFTLFFKHNPAPSQGKKCNP